VQCKSTQHGVAPIKMVDNARVSPDGVVEASGVTLMNPRACAAILSDYNNLKNKSEGNFHTDLWAVIFDFDELFKKTMSKYPMLECIAQCKINGMQNVNI
jgi:hypothetical protein